MDQFVLCFFGHFFHNLAKAQAPWVYLSKENSRLGDGGQVLAGVEHLEDGPGADPHLW